MWIFVSDLIRRSRIYNVFNKHRERCRSGRAWRSDRGIVAAGGGDSAFYFVFQVFLLAVLLYFALASLRT
eukprot:g30293.t1